MRPCPAQGQTARGETCFGLLPVGGGGLAPPLPDAAPAEAWWAQVSGGRWQPRAVPLPPVTLREDAARWCARGGMGPGPRNAPALVRTALEMLPPLGPDVPEVVLVVIAGPVAPHAWRVAGGGVAVAPGRWVRRYAALPRDAALGTWVHEMAHLLLRWPDVPSSPCLMGQGALIGGEPTPPGPALAWAAGWLEALPPANGLPSRALGPHQAMALPWAGLQVLVTRRGAQFFLHDRDRPGPPLGRGILADLDAPLLAGISPALELLRRTGR